MIELSLIQALTRAANPKSYVGISEDESGLVVLKVARGRNQPRELDLTRQDWTKLDRDLQQRIIPAAKWHALQEFSKISNVKLNTVTDHEIYGESHYTLITIDVFSSVAIIKSGTEERIYSFAELLDTAEWFQSHEVCLCRFAEARLNKAVGALVTLDNRSNQAELGAAGKAFITQEVMKVRCGFADQDYLRYVVAVLTDLHLIAEATIEIGRASCRERV